MKLVKLSEAKANLSRYVDYVRRGGQVRILLRDTPVADLVAVGTHAEEGEADALLLSSLERRGLVRRGSGDVPPELLTPGPRAKGRPISQTLVEARRAGR